MASVEEVYRELGVVHGTDCTVCDITDRSISVRKNKGYLTHVLSVLLLLAALFVVGWGLIATGYFIARGMEWHNPRTYIYERYNWYRMYEDGSVQAETRDGKIVTFCLRGGMCE